MPGCGLSISQPFSCLTLTTTLGETQLLHLAGEEMDCERMESDLHRICYVAPLGFEPSQDDLPY